MGHPKFNLGRRGAGHRWWGRQSPTGQSRPGGSSPADQGVTANDDQCRSSLRQLCRSEEPRRHDQRRQLSSRLQRVFVNVHERPRGRRWSEDRPPPRRDEPGVCRLMRRRRAPSSRRMTTSSSPSPRFFRTATRETHDTPVIAASSPGALPGPALHPTLLWSRPMPPSNSCSSPRSTSGGIFKGKKVGIFYGATSDVPELRPCRPT